LLFRVPPLIFECASLDLLFVNFPKTNQFSLRERCSLLRTGSGAAILLMAIVAAKCIAQSPHAPAGEQKTPQKPTAQKRTGSAAAAELQKRLDRAQKAKSSGDPAQVAHANELVIALALRELGQVRLIESASAQAAELYGRSLDFENIPDTRVDLALAHLQAGQADKAIEEADQALLDDPNNVRAFQVLGRAWSLKNDIPRAVHALTRAAEITPNLENLYSLAITLLASKDPADRPRAEQAFAQMGKSVGDSGSLHVMFGRAYRDAGDLHAAIREFEIAIKLDTRTPHAHYFLGLAHLASNEWVATPEVKSEFKRELEFYPRDYLANYMMGFLVSAERKYDQADKYLKLATTLNLEAPEPWLYLGLNAYAENNMSQAEEYFRKAILLTGSDDARSNYQIRRAYIDLGRILTISGRKEEAAKYLDKARELQNKVLQSSQQGMASHFMEEGADTAAASAVVMPPLTNDKAETASSEYADPFAEVDPAVLARSNLTVELKEEAASQEKQLRAVLAQSFSDLGTSDAIRKDYAAALGHYQEAEHWDADFPGILRNLGMAAFRAQNYPEAIRGLSVGLASHPEDAAARAMLGMAYFGEENYQKAVDTFEPLGKKGMQDAAVGYTWAASLARLGQLPQATRVLEEYEKEDRPKDTLMLTGQLWIEIEDYAKAVATFHRALQKDPALPKAHYFAGQACIHWQHWDEAAQEFHEELQHVPEDAEARYNLGFVYLQQSHVAEAEKLFQEVIAANPEHANAQYEYGKILMDRGEFQNAISHLEIAARLSPRTDYVHYQLQVAYRKEGRVADADRELELYKKIKAKKRGREGPATAEQTP
jgi:tetratricopeptide (TPR) repeat protein